MFARNVAVLAGTLLVTVHALAEDLLDPEVAFRATATLIKPDVVEVRYQTAPGYYLYRDRLAYDLEPGAGAARLGKPYLPPGKIKRDKFFGRQVIYRNATVVRLPVSAPAGMPLTLVADLQGCADLGVCYPPVRRKLALSPVPPLQ